MDYDNSFQLISYISKKTGVSCVLIGGFAVNYYKVTRQTLDVDFLITKENFDKILPSLEKAGYRQDYKQEVFARLRNDKARLLDIDFMFVDIDTLNKIIKEAKETTIGSQKFIVPTLNHLIALKLHAIKYNPKIREYKDLPDIINLIIINQVNYSDNDFHQLCLKYGTEELYQKIMTVLKG